MKKFFLTGCVSIASIMVSQETEAYSNMATDSELKGKRHAVLPINSDNKICYSGVVVITGKNQEKLYNDAKEYVLLNYTSREFPTILDERNDRIYVKGRFKVPHLKYGFPIFVHVTKWDLVYTAKFYYKDGKYRYEITDLFIMKKLPAKIKQQYWGYGYATGNINEAKVIKKDMEKVYNKKIRRTRFALICWKVDKGIKAELANFEKYMRQENDLKKW